MNFVEIIYFTSVLLIVYSYVFYPFILFIICLFRDSLKERGLDNNERSYPKVGVILSAFNEEKHIKNRIDNILEQNYDESLLNIYVGSDGSNDNTNHILESINSERLHLNLYEKNRGKVSVINDLIEQAEEDILIFTDANTYFDKNTISKLVEKFVDESVGAVCGELVFHSVGADDQDQKYWSFERKLKKREARINGLCGANGANYGIRRKLYSKLNNNTIVDDLTIVMNISAKGYRVIYAEEAKAYEASAPSLKDEYKRRVRIGMGNYQAFMQFLPYIFKSNGINRFTYI